LDNKKLLIEGAGTNDTWVWRDVEFTDFSVKATYNFLLGEEPAEYKDMFVKFWKLKTLPSKQFTTWRVLTNTIATKENLLRHGISLLCDHYPLCDVDEETIRHNFFECRVSWRIWGMCLEWLRFSSVFHCDAQMHFKMFKLLGLKHATIRCWGGIWVGIIGEIWNYINRVVFKNVRVDLVEVFILVQMKT